MGEGEGGEGLKHMVMEELTLGAEHVMQHLDNEELYARNLCSFY